MNEVLLLRARQAVADTQAQTYTKRAILAGEWDRGSLVQEAYARLVRKAG